MNTEIPPGFPITFCPPGAAAGIEPQYLRPTGRNGMSSSAAREPQIYEHHTRSLAQAKIAQAIKDMGSRMNGAHTANNKTQALNWIASDDFLKWCDLAGIHPDTVRRKAAEVIAKGNRHRTPRGQGIRYSDGVKARARQKAQELFT